MGNDALSTVFIVLGIILMVVAVIMVVLPAPEAAVRAPLEFLSDFFIRIVIAAILFVIGVILLFLGFR